MVDSSVIRRKMGVGLVKCLYCFHLGEEETRRRWWSERERGCCLKKGKEFNLGPWRKCGWFIPCDEYQEGFMSNLIQNDFVVVKEAWGKFTV